MEPPLTPPPDSDESDCEYDVSLLPPRPVVFVPPLSFSMVASQIYRSGHPLETNFPFLEKLRLRTIIYLADQDYLPENIQWCKSQSIKIHHFRVAHVREPFVENNAPAITASLKIIADERTHPILLHSNKGKHRVGVLVGCLRKILQNWRLAAIFAEYGRFAGDKGVADLEFIEMFEPTEVQNHFTDGIRRC